MKSVLDKTQVDCFSILLTSITGVFICWTGILDWTTGLTHLMFKPFPLAQAQAQVKVLLPVKLMHLGLVLLRLKSSECLVACL